MLRAAEARKPGFGAIRAHAAAAADVQGRDRAHLRVAATRSSAAQPGVRRAAGRRADLPGRSPAAHSPRTERARSRGGAATRAPSSQTSATSTSSGSAEHEHVDGADPDPAQRDAEAVQRPVAVVHRRGLRGRLQMQRDRRVVRGADRRRRVPLQALDPRGQRGDLSPAPRLSARPRAASRAAPAAARSCGRSRSGRPAGPATSTCSPVIVPSAESRVIAVWTWARGIFSVRSARARPSRASSRAPTSGSRRATTRCAARA